MTVEKEGIFIALVKTLRYYEVDGHPDTTLHETEPFTSYVGAIDWLRGCCARDAMLHDVRLDDAFKWGGDVDKKDAVAERLLKWSTHINSVTTEMIYLFERLEVCGAYTQIVRHCYELMWRPLRP